VLLQGCSRNGGTNHGQNYTSPGHTSRLQLLCELRQPRSNLAMSVTTDLNIRAAEH
jgi:hypothetical protein